MKTSVMMWSINSWSEHFPSGAIIFRKSVSLFRSNYARDHSRFRNSPIRLADCHKIDFFIAYPTLDGWFYQYFPAFFVACYVWCMAKTATCHPSVYKLTADFHKRDKIYFMIIKLCYYELVINDIIVDKCTLLFYYTVLLKHACILVHYILTLNCYSCLSHCHHMHTALCISVMWCIHYSNIM